AVRQGRVGLVEQLGRARLDVGGLAGDGGAAGGQVGDGDLGHLGVDVLHVHGGVVAVVALVDDGQVHGGRSAPDAAPAGEAGDGAALGDQEHRRDRLVGGHDRGAEEAVGEA